MGQNTDSSPFWPVGKVTDVRHLVSELRIAGDGLLVHSGALLADSARLRLRAATAREDSERFHALANSLEANVANSSEASVT